MELGQRIKQARLDAGLSQRQLCGEVITRNMLSLIESGRARPSMDTLAYLAARLGKSVSFFLEEQAVTSPNLQSIDKARAAYTRGQHRLCLEALEDFRCPDGVFGDERWLLEALCLTALARQALEDGKNAYAGSLLDKAEQAGAKTVYDSQALQRQRLLLRCRAEPDTACQLAPRLPPLTPELLLRGRAALQDEDPGLCARILEAADVRDEEWFLLRGQAALALGDFAGAAEFLHRAEERYPRQCVPLLEQCYRELEDYKRAYEYACRQRQA